MERNINDLPLMSNINQVTLHHFLLDLYWNSYSRTFIGNLVIFLTPKDVDDNYNSSVNNLTFETILDCYNIDVSSVHKIDYPSYNYSSNVDFNNGRAVDVLYSDTLKLVDFDTSIGHIGEELYWSCDKWCLKISCSYNQESRSPVCVLVRYSTKPDSKSLTLSLDQDNRVCLYTSGHWLNNRGLFASQDVPGAVSTWQARVTVDDDFVVLMTGDEPCICETLPDRKLRYSSYSRALLPSSTFALAIGQWASVKLTKCVLNAKIVESTLYGPLSFLPTATRIFDPYIAKCLSSASKILTEYPFKRLDLVILPSNFSSLALANPNMIFVSQSLLSNNGAAGVHIGHEICHSWFGLMIGPMDWSEEWLTEGVVTYLEDYLHSVVARYNYLDYSELRAVIRHRILCSEMATTQPELQILSAQSEDSKGDNYVKNGLNPDKRFTQVHYLKGYFLLRYLSKFIPHEDFLNFFKALAQNCPALISSQFIFRVLFELFPCLQSEFYLTESVLRRNWLETPGLPMELLKFELPTNNPLISQTQIELRNWLNYSRKKKRKGNHRLKKIPPDFPSNLASDQLVLLLEWLLDESSNVQNILPVLRSSYNILNEDAEVRHRWCELVIKNKCKMFYNDIKQFLLNDQAMGVYLYGEAMISRDKTLILETRNVFQDIKDELDEDTRVVVSSMLYPESKEHNSVY